MCLYLIPVQMCLHVLIHQKKVCATNNLQISSLCVKDLSLATEELIGRARASPPSRSAGADFFLYNYVIRRCSLWSPRAPALRANVKPARSHPVTWQTSYPKLASPCRVSWASLRLTSKPWLVYCDSQFGLPLSLTSSGFTGQLPFAALLDAERVSWGLATLGFNTGGVTM